MSERTAIYPGTFDPVTYGHLDLVKRAARLFDRLLVCVAPGGERTWLPQTERVRLIQPLLADMGNAEVEPFEGLLVDHARRRGASALIRGVRGVRDYEYEMDMAFANEGLAPEILTIFVAPSADTALVSSSLVREVASLGGDVSAWVPPAVAERLIAHLKRP